MPVTRFDVALRRPLADGRSFGDVGSYEELKGRLVFALDPDHAANRDITDVGLAPRNARGQVEFAADVSILLPVDRGRASGRLLLDVVNRGNTVSVPNFNHATRPVFRPGSDPDPPIDVGDGFLMRHGWVIAACGWQCDLPDLPGLLRLHGVEAPGPDGAPLRGGCTCSCRRRRTCRTSCSPIAATCPTPPPTWTSATRCYSCATSRTASPGRSRASSGASPATEGSCPTAAISGSKADSRAAASITSSTPPRARACWGSAWRRCATAWHGSSTGRGRRAIPRRARCATRMPTERERTADPRASIEERYRGRDDHLARVREAARALAKDGYLLEEDVEVSVAFAARAWDHWLPV